MTTTDVPLLSICGDEYPIETMEKDHLALKEPWPGHRFIRMGASIDWDGNWSLVFVDTMKGERVVPVIDFGDVYPVMRKLNL